MRIFGVDFTSAPRRAKPITVACGSVRGRTLHVEEIENLENLAAFEDFLGRPGPWVAGIDFPFGLPRDAIQAFKWPQRWAAMVRHCGAIGKTRFVETLNNDRISRPDGSKYRYRRGDRIAGSSPAVRLHQVPVGLMFYEGARRLESSSACVPFLRENDDNRIALEAYPGHLAKGRLGIASYKSDEQRKQTPQRLANRRKIVDTICKGEPLGIRLSASRPPLESFVSDGSGDRLDAAICALQAAWGWTRKRNSFGLPKDLDPIEGWVVSVNKE